MYPTAKAGYMYMGYVSRGGGGFDLSLSIIQNYMYDKLCYM